MGASWVSLSDARHVLMGCHSDGDGCQMGATGKGILASTWHLSQPQVTESMLSIGATLSVLSTVTR